MNLRSPILALVLGLGLVWLSTGPAAADKDDAERIDKLIEQLGSGSFKEREAATKALDAIGTPALDKLRKAADSEDAEIKRRAADLVTRIGKRAEVSRVLAAKRVHLIYKDTPLKEAVADFKKQSGYDLVIHDPDNKLTDRKVTLDTGDVTFWEAFDQFCDKAGIVQLTQQDMMQQMMQDMMKRQQEMIKQFKIAPPPAKKPEVKEAPARPAPPKDAKPPATPKPEGAKAEQEREADVARARAIAAVEQAKAEVALRQAEEILVVLQAQAAAPPQAAVARGVMMGPGSGGMLAFSAEQIMLVDGKRKPRPTHYGGSVRVRAVEQALPPGVEQAPFGVNLEASTEPKLQLRAITSARITKAVDDNGQTLAQAEPAESDDERFVVFPGGAKRVIMRGGAGLTMYGMGGGPSQTFIALKKGDKPSKSLKELSGTLTIQALDAPEPLITVENVLKSGGTTTKGKTGGQLKVVDASKTEEGHVKLQVELDLPPDVIPAGSQGFAGFMSAPAMRLRAVLPPVPPPAAPAVAPPKDKPAEKPKEAPAKEAKAPAKEQVKDKPVAAQPPPPPAAVPGIAVAPAALIAPPGPPQGGARNPGNSFNGLSLVDGKGEKLSILHVGAHSRVAAAGNVETTYELTFEVKKDQGEPAKLIFSGSRTVTFEVPFVLKDVPLK